MNISDREVMSNFKEKVTLLTKKTNSLDKKVDKILAALEDDQYSSSTGLITEVNELREQMMTLMYINRSIKRVFWWLMAILGSILTFIITNFLRKN